MHYLQILKLAAPETIVLIGALAVLAVDLLVMRELSLRIRGTVAAWLGCFACGLAFAWICALPAYGNIGDGMLAAYPMGQWVKAALLALAAFALLLAADGEFTPHIGEYFATLLLGITGMMFLISAEDFLMVFVALELSSLSLYILAGFNKASRFSAEAALKYFLFGGLSAAMALFGFSLVYGATGSTTLPAVAAAVNSAHFDPLFRVGLVLIIVGFGFKVAVVPFHLWAPDAYQAAPVPSAAFIASGSKLASFFVFARVLGSGFVDPADLARRDFFQPGWMPVAAVVAIASMVLGNVAAIVQSSVRRLLAYSAVAHAGYMLLAILSRPDIGVPALVYYSVTYGLTTLGAFGVVALVERRAGGDSLEDFAGLSRRSPLLAISMLTFMLSLAGIPPLAGFFGKFYVFAAALKAQPNAGLVWLVVIAIAMSAVSLYYYLKVLKQVFVAPGKTEPLSLPLSGTLPVYLLALAVLLLGCFPSLLVEPLVRMAATLIG